MLTVSKKIPHHEKIVSAFPKISKVERERIWSVFRFCTGNLGGLSGEELQKEPRLQGKRGISYGGFKEVKTLIEGIFDDQTPTFHLTGINNSERFTYTCLGGLLEEHKVEQWEALIKTLERLLSERGYLNENQLTRQEHYLIGSSLPIHFAKWPYKPIGLIRKKERISLSDIRKARELEVVGLALGEYYCVPEGEHVWIAREILDENGKMLQDPRPIDKDKLAKFLKEYPLVEAIEASLVPNLTKSSNFPNRRN